MNLPKSPRRLTGPKNAQMPGQIHRIRAVLSIEKSTRDLALFDVALDSKLRGCDIVRLSVSDVSTDGVILDRARVIQQKTGQPV